MRLEGRFALKRAATSLKWGVASRASRFCGAGADLRPLTRQNPDAMATGLSACSGMEFSSKKKDAQMGAPLYCFVRNCAHRL